MSESENIRAFYTPNRRKLVPIGAVEKMAGVPTNTLYNALHPSVLRAIPEHHLENIVNVLVIVGYVPTPEFAGDFL